MRVPTVRNMQQIMIGFVVIILSLILGEALVAVFKLPLPGTVVGLAVLFAGFAIVPSLAEMVVPVCQLLLRNFALFLFPLGAGFLQLSGVGIGGFLKIIITIVISLALSMLLCAVVFQYFKRHD